MIGLVNGIGIAIFRVNALIMTLGISVITLGLLTVEAQKQFTALVPGFVATLGSERFLTYIPYDLLVWAPISALIILGLRYSGIGRMIYAVGDNPVASRLAGVRVWQVQLFVYAACGVLSALAGVLLVGFNNAADLGIATRFLLPSVAAVVIGGTSIFGGYGGYVGTILGALILTVLDSLLTILNASRGDARDPLRPDRARARGDLRAPGLVRVGARRLAEPGRSADGCDGLDLDLELGKRERAHLDDRVGRVGRREPAPPQLDDLPEVRHVREEDRDLHDAVEARAAGLEDAREVAEDLLGLRVEVAGAHDVAVLVQGRLARDDDEVSDAEALREQVRLERIRVETDLARVGHTRSSTAAATRVVRNHCDRSGAQTIVKRTSRPPVIRLET